MAERARHGAGQGRHVDEVRRPEPLGVGQRVAQDEPALGVGVGDVDRLAVERGDDVAGPGRMRAGHVLDRRRDREERRAGRQPGDGGDGRDDGARTGLVHLHLFHPVGRLDADAARVEADALADDRQVAVEGVALPFPARAHDDHPRRVVAAPADGHEHAHAELGGALAARSRRSTGRACSATARASSARTSGLTSLEARFDSVRAKFAPSPMTMPRSAAVVSAAASAPGAMRISSSRTGGAVSTSSR